MSEAEIKNDSNMCLIALLMRGFGYTVDEYRLILTGTIDDFERAERQRAAGASLRKVIDCLLDDLNVRKEQQS